jgi:hypothetical protein
MDDYKRELQTIDFLLNEMAIRENILVLTSSTRLEYKEHKLTIIANNKAKT